MAISVETRTKIIELTVGMVNAAPGAAILSELAEIIDSGASLNELAIAIANNPAFETLYPASLSNNEFSSSFLAVLLGDEVDAAALSAAVNELETVLKAGTHRGAAMYAAVTALSSIAESDASFGAAAAALHNKSEVANYYSVTTQQSANTVEELISIVSGVASNEASKTAALAHVDFLAATGTLFTLTVHTDSGSAFKGGDKNDYYAAIVANGGAAETLNPSDVLDGGNGIDTLNITATESGLALTTSQISNIEIINVRSTGVATTVDASKIAGETSINSDKNTGALTVFNLADGAAIGVVGNGSLTNGAVVFNYETIDTPITLNLKGGTKAGTTVSTTENTGTAATINSSGAHNFIGALDLATNTTITSLVVNALSSLTATLTADYAATASLIVTGVGKVDLGSGGTFKTIIASSNSGGLTMQLSPETTTFIGTTNSDTISTALLGSPSIGIINGGGGDDTLVVIAPADVSTVALRTAYTGFELLSNKTASPIAVDGFSGINNLITSSDGGGLTAMTVTQAASVRVTANQTGGVTYTLAASGGSSDVLSLNFDSASGTSVINAARLIVPGFETVVLKSNTGPSSLFDSKSGLALAKTDYGNFGFSSAAGLKTVEVAGSKTAFVDITSNTSSLTALDASANTAGVNLSVGGQSGTIVVSGSSAADIITLSAVNPGGVQNIYAGAGNDSIAGLQSVIGVATINGGEDIDTLSITDNGFVLINDNYFAGVSSVEKITLGATIGLNFSIGGFANSLATGNGGVLDVTAVALATDLDTTINATELSVGNSLKLTLTNTETGASANTISVTMSQGADVIKITQTGATSDGITIGGGVAALASTAIKTVDLSGVATGGAISVTTGAGADIVKAAAIAGTYVLGAGNDTFIGGAGVDSVTGGAGVDTMSGGAGADHFIFNDVDTDIDTTVGAVTDIITDFVSTSDKLHFNTAGSGTNYVEQLTAAADLAALLAAAHTALNGTVQYYFGVVGTNGYLVFDADGIGYTSVIQLTGVTNMAAGDIV